MALGSLTTLTLVIIVLLSMFASGAVAVTATVSSSGVITTPNLSVYSDSACTKRLTSIDWGNIAQGSQVTKTVYVKNEGTTALTLHMSTTNWNPATASGPITISWDRESTALAVNQVTTVTLTLKTAATISGVTTFSTNIVISGTA